MIDAYPKSFLAVGAVRSFVPFFEVFFPSFLTLLNKALLLGTLFSSLDLL